MVALDVIVGMAPQLVVGAVGLFILVRSSEIVVDRLTAVAQFYDVPDTLIAMSVIAIGTSLPEISSHVMASLGILSGSLDYAVASATVLGGNMGSSVAQQTLLVGLFLIGFGTVTVSKKFMRFTYVPMILASLLTMAVAVDGVFSRLDGLILAGVFLGYTYYSFENRERGAAVPESASDHVKRDVAVSVLGIGAVLVSAFLVLWSVEGMVSQLRLGGSMIGVITIGVASALPELSTVLMAIRKKSEGIALGTLIGSNIVNPLLAIGLGSMISTYKVPQAFIAWDLPFKIVVGVGLFAYLRYVSDNRIGRRAGVYLVVLYFVFVAVRFLFFAAQ